MGAAQFDREAFIPPKDVGRRNPLVALIFGLIAAALIVLGFIAYKFGFKTLDIGNAPPKNTELSTLENKLTSMEYRLGQLEKRRRNASAESLTPEKKEENHNSKNLTSLPATAPRVVYLRPQAAGSQQSSPVSTNPTPRVQDIGQGSDVSSLRRDVQASREEWEATTNRLGSVVGELGSQRSDIESNKRGLDTLLEHTHRDVLSFQLQRKAGWVHVGSVALRLRSTDPGTGRYTLRLQINDNAVELKDRVIQEVVEFYTPASAAPIELVVNSVSRNEASGKIAVPQDHPRTHM